MCRAAVLLRKPTAHYTLHPLPEFDSSPWQLAPFKKGGSARLRPIAGTVRGRVIGQDGSPVPAHRPLLSTLFHKYDDV